MTRSTELAQSLRQMVAVLQAERQALAGLDLDGIMGCAVSKRGLCDAIAADSAGDLPDDECRVLLEAARRLNEVNRQIRNLVAANVSARLDALTGSPALYRTGSGKHPAYAYAGAAR
jgi:hypothetical protein